MRRSFAFSSVLFLFAGLLYAANRPNEKNSPNAYFIGIDLDSPATSPAILLGGNGQTIAPVTYRIWDDNSQWADLASSRGTYTWTNLDAIMNKVSTSTTHLIYTWASVPAWASTNATDALCSYGTGWCWPPTDLNSSCTAQGSLAGQQFSDNCRVREAVNDVLLHATANGTPFWAIELGNEPNMCEPGQGDATCHSSTYVTWNGTAADHAKMMKAVADQARITQPGIVIIGPGVGANSGVPNCTTNGYGLTWANQWFGAAVHPTVDYAAFHGYTSSLTVPEEVATNISIYRGCANFPAATPVYDTEGSWGSTPFNGSTIPSIVRASNVVTVTCTDSGNHDCGYTSADNGQNIVITAVADSSFNGTFAIASANAGTLTFTYNQTGSNASSSGGSQVKQAYVQPQANFVGRWLLLQFSQSVPAIWYAWGNGGWGQLCDKWTVSSCSSVRIAGTAYGEVYKWLADATPNGTCTQNGTVWTCSYTKADGYKSLAVWDTSGTSTYTFPANYQQARDLTGGTTPLSGTTVSIGTAPILLESLSRNGAGK